TSVDGDTNLWLIVNTTNVAHGIQTFSLNASGFDTNGQPVATNIFLQLQGAHIWNGALAVTNLWSDPASWLGGIPTAGRDVVFTDIGAQTNSGAGIVFTNSYVDNDVTIGSLRFSHTSITNAIATNSDLRPRSHTLF